MGVLWTVLLAWTLNGGLGLSVVPYAVTDSTRDVSVAPYLRVQALNPLPGLSVNLALRGYRADTARPKAPALRLLVANVHFQRPGVPVSLCVGRQFQYLGLGGLVDGASVGFRLNHAELSALLGYRAPSVFDDTTGLEIRSQNPLFAVQARMDPLARLQVYAGYGREGLEDTVVQAPLWLGFRSYDHAWNLEGELAYDLEYSVLSRGRLSASYRIPRALLHFHYRYQDPWRDFLKLTLPSWLRDDPVKYSIPTHRLEASVRLQDPLPGASFGLFYAYNTETSYRHLWMAYRLQRLYLRVWTGEEWEGTAYGGLLTYSHRLNPRLSALLQLRLAKSPRYDGLVYSLRPRLVWRFPGSGLSVQAEFRFWKLPGVQWETQGYLGLHLPFSRRF